MHLPWGRSVLSRVLGVLLSLLTVTTTLHGQDHAADRRRFLAPGTPTSDDPRRVPVGPAPRGPDGAIVLVGGRLFDGTGAAARPATVVIERNIITGILAPGETGWPAGARVLDAAGMTVLPGLIDLHTHLTDGQLPTLSAEQQLDPADATLRAVEKLRIYAEAGITSARDVGSLDGIFRLKRWVSDRRLTGPRIFAAGQLIVSTGGHGSEGLGAVADRSPFRIAAGADQWRQAVREQFDKGADFIKITSHFSRAEVQAAAEEAHALGLKITCDCETFYIDWAVDAGVDMIEHPLPRTDDVIRKMASKKVEADPTLIPYQIIFDDDGGYFGSTSRRFAFGKDANLDVLRRMKRAGVTIGVGTDLISDWFRRLPMAYITELKNLVAAGFTPTEALMAATKVNAQMLDMSDKLGTIERGKLADVVVVRGTPDANLDDLQQVTWVIRDGEVIVAGGAALLPVRAAKAAAAAKTY